MLRRVEFPIALAVILTGLRIAAVQVVATATLGAIIGGGGLGRYIVDGLARQDYPRLYAGAFLVALLALVVELGFTWWIGAPSGGPRLERLREARDRLARHRRL